MAITEEGSSSDAALASQGEYVVFLNFRGADTRPNFTDFLYHRLVGAGVHVFLDNEGIRPGEVISEKLQQAIKNSKIYIPIFSQTYASSKWCLRELALMVKNVSESKDEKSILPIFFLVEPDDVKLKKSLYQAAFKKHEKNFRDEVKAWKRALRKVDERKGWVVKKDTSQNEIVELVVQEVLKQQRIKERLVFDSVGYDDRVKYLIELLDVKQQDVRLIQIYGMSGMGKTIIAKAVFDKLKIHFGRHCSFLENVGEFLTKEGIIYLQNKLLYDIGSPGFKVQFHDSHERMMRIGATLKNKKVLVVLDDVDENVPIQNLIGNSRLCQGSRIIITTRYSNIPQIGGFEGITQQYEMQQMDNDRALRFFCKHAFGKDFPLNDYRELSGNIVSLMDGHPLAVKVVGLSLKEKDKSFWEETLDKLREKPVKEIINKLKIIYDELEDHEKQIFLDIACFLFDEKKTDATYMWNHCKFYPKRGIDVLTKRCLIKILDNDQFQMHNQLIKLGRLIVCQESQFNPREQSRLWDAKEALEIIRAKEMKDKVQAIKMDELNDSIKITNEEFERLQNLRLLKLGKGTYAADFAKYCSKLGWISCRSPNWDLTRHNMNRNNLVVLKLHETGYTDDAKAWDLIKSAENLKVLSLTQCGGIKTTPDFSNCSGLERLTLARCDKLKRIESFVGGLTSLIELEIECCESLTDLPQEVGALVKLQRFSLRGCSGLTELPWSLEKLTSLIELDLSKTGIAKLPDSMKGLLKLESLLVVDTVMKEFLKYINKLRSLRVLSSPKNGSYSPEHHVRQLPSRISMSEILEELDRSGREEMTDGTPVGILDLSSFRTLNLTSTQIYDIPRNIDMLHHLQTVSEIQVLSELPPRTINVPHQQAASTSELASLRRLDLKTDEKFSSSPLRFDLLCSSFSWADLLPSSLILGNLTTIEFYYVEVEDIPLDRLPGVESLTAHGCELPHRLTITSENLRQAHLSSCPRLSEISFSYSEKLKSFVVSGCGSLEIINWSDCVKNLEKLEIHQCDELTDVRGLEHLESLKYLKVTQCRSLRRLIDAYNTNIPVDCLVKIEGCGDIFKDSTPSFPPGMPLRRYVLDILQYSSNSESKSDKTKTEGGEKAKATPWWKRIGLWLYPKKRIGLWGTSRESCDAEEEEENEKEKDAAEFNISGSDEVSDYASANESLTDVTSSVDDSQSEPDATESFDAMENRRQMRNERIECYDSVDGGSTKSMENKKKGKDEIGEPVNPSDVVGLNCQTNEGFEHYERSCKPTTEVEDQRDFSSVKRDTTVETARVLAKTGEGSGTGCPSNPGTDTAKRGRARGIAPSSRNSRASWSGRDAASTSGTASNLGRGIASSSQSSATLSIGRDRCSTSGKDRGSSSRRGNN